MIRDKSCSCVLWAMDSVNPDVLAKIVNYNDNSNEIDALGSVGESIRAVIKRNNVDIETTAAQSIANLNISYSSALENGDVLCVQATVNGFVSYDQDCKTIPTPQFGFVPVS